MENLKNILEKITVLGIDPSLSNTGLSLIINGEIVKVHNINTGKKKTYFEKLKYITYEIFNFCVLIKTPQVIAIETPYIGHFGGNSSLKIAEVRGVIVASLTSFFRADIFPEFVDVSAVQAKVVLGVSPRLKRVESKEQVKKNVCLNFPKLQEASQDIIDATAIAVAGAKFFKTQNILTCS